MVLLSGNILVFMRPLYIIIRAQFSPCHWSMPFLNLYHHHKILLLSMIVSIMDPHSTIHNPQSTKIIFGINI
jgi:hypothetical protein